MEGKITKVIVNPILEYSSGTEENLRSPTDVYDASAYIFATPNGGGGAVDLFVGDYKWTTPGGVSAGLESWNGISTGTSYGAARFSI